MKKIYYILTLVAAAMTISACNNAFEDEGPAFNGGEGSDNTITFVVGPETDADGRTALDLVGDADNDVEGGKITLWNGTEKAGLYYNYRAAGAGSDTKVANAQNIEYTATLGSDSATATFTGEAEWVDVGADAHKFYFYYPRNEGSESHTKVHGILPAEQDYDATASKWDMSEYDFVYANNSKAMPESAVELKIKRAFAVLRLGITNKAGEDVIIKEVSITSEGGKVLAGEFIANISKSDVEQGLTSHTVASGTNYGYWKSTNSTITTTVTNGAVAATEKIDVRFMLNAGYAPKAESPYYDETTSYLEGDTFTVRIKTDKGTHPAVQFTAGALLRGQRAGKSITLEPIPAGEPTVTAIESDHSTKTKFYLNNTITIKGSNLQNADNVKIGGVSVEPEVLNDGAELVVKVPDCTGAATEAASYAITYGADKELGNITVYPFYHYENMMLGCGSNSKSTYSETASLNSFFYPDLGQSVAVSKWKEDKLDKWALGEAEYPTPVVHESNKYVSHDKSKISEADYYSVLPYFFFITNSSNKFTLVTPCNSPNVLKCHFIDGVSVSDQSGTPNLWFRNMRTANSAENKWYKAVKNGDITEMTAEAYTGSMASAGAPEFKSATTDLSGQASQWHVGSVIMMQYVTYEKASKPSAMSDVAKFGFIHIKEVTCADLTTGLTLPTREGHIKFDLYWSKKLN